MEADKEIQLTVAEAVHMDVGRAIARMGSKGMAELGIAAGDTILIKGKSSAVATVWRARPQDDKLDLLRIDGILRYNAETSIGEKVSVKKVECDAAESITLGPLEEVRFTGDPVDYFHDKLLDKPFMKGNKLVIEIMGTTLHYVVTQTSPKGCVRVNENTKLTILEKTVEPESFRKIPEVTYEDIGGLRTEIDSIREMVELPMKHPEVFERLGVGAPKGVLLTGPPGTGKTLLAKAVASETDSTFYSINGPEIMSKYYGESEKQLREMFDEANKNAPAIIFIDEIDSIAPKREEVTGEVERRVVAQLLTLMDGLKSRGQVVVIGATNREGALDPALRRPGRFDREIPINAPDSEGREEILTIHTRGMPLNKDVKLDRVAELTVGFTGADLEVLCKEAALKSLKKYIPALKEFNDKVPTNVLEKLNINMEHFAEALRKVEPSAMREVLIRTPNITWKDIGGLEDVKESLKEAIVWPLMEPESFEAVGIKPPKGILLYGPPGCGKTMLAKAIANEANANFISVKGPELISKWVGDSEKHIRDIFKRARSVAPTVIFFDEFDSISKIRGTSLTDSTERMVNQLLTELDGIEELQKVTIIAATNRPDLIDPGLLRPGRIDLKLEIPQPDEKSRVKIFQVHTKGMPIGDDVDFKALAKIAKEMTGADIQWICREAGMFALRAAKEKGNTKKVQVGKEHFAEAFSLVKEKIKDLDQERDTDMFI